MVWYDYGVAKRSGTPFPDGFRLACYKNILGQKLLRSCHEELDVLTKKGASG